MITNAMQIRMLGRSFHQASSRQKWFIVSWAKLARKDSLHIRNTLLNCKATIWSTGTRSSQWSKVNIHHHMLQNTFLTTAAERVEKDVDELPYDLVFASKGIDLWSLGEMVYNFETGQDLLI